LADDFRVIDVVDFEHLDEWIVVDEIVQLLGAHQEATTRNFSVKNLHHNWMFLPANNSSSVDRLLVVSHASFLHQIDNTASEHLRVDSQIFVIVQLSEDSVGNVSDSHL
jgi:hypothetical protein